MGLKEELLELKELLDGGLLTQEEFDDQKAAVLTAAKRETCIHLCARVNV